MNFKTAFSGIFRSTCKVYENQLKPKHKRLTEPEIKSITNTINELQKIVEYNKGHEVVPDEIIQHNIYDSGPTLKKYVDNQNRIHRDWKHRFFYPLFWLGKRIMGKYLVKKVPNQLQFKNLKIIDKAAEKTFHDWCTFVTVMKNKGEAITKKDVAKSMKSGTIKIVRTLKEMALTVCKNDTAYLEMASIFAFNLSVEMNKQHEKNPKHIVYTSNLISDPAYFRALFDISNNRVILKPLKNPFETSIATSVKAEPRKEMKVISDKPFLQ